MENKVVRYSSKNELVLEQIRHEIMDGELQVGLVYSASKIAERLGVSKMPVNYAILKLAEQGMITQLPNVGFRVNELNWRQIEELMYIKNEMLKLTLRWLIPTVSKEEIQEMTRAVDLIFEAIEQDSKEQYLKSTKDFYLLFPRFAQAEKCYEYFERYWDFEGLYASDIHQNKEALFQLCEEHRALVDAVAQRELEKILQIADEHLAHSLRYLKKLKDI